MIGTYRKSIRKHQQGGTIIKNNVSLTCIATIGLATGWFEIIEILTFDLNEATASNDEYINESSARISQLFNNTWI